MLIWCQWHVALVVVVGGHCAAPFTQKSNGQSSSWTCDSPPTEYGGVAYVYNIGAYEVTAGQYTEFLNAVAATDTFGLYNANMWDSERGCKIKQAGSSPRFSYSVAGDWADRPVNYVSWDDAARFANWLHNGQPSGPQGLSTTEDGSYYLDGATSVAALMAIVRKPDATCVIPSQDEWYSSVSQEQRRDGRLLGKYHEQQQHSEQRPHQSRPGQQRDLL